MGWIQEIKDGICVMCKMNFNVSISVHNNREQPFKYATVGFFSAHKKRFINNIFHCAFCVAVEMEARQVVSRLITFLSVEDAPQKETPWQYMSSHLPNSISPLHIPRQSLLLNANDT